MNLTILTPEKEVYTGTIRSVVVPGTSGGFEILRGHAPLVSSLTEGTIRVVDESGSQTSYTIERGFVEVIRDEVSLLVRGLQTV